LPYSKTPFDKKTFKAGGTQQQWKLAGAVGKFTCDNLQIGDVTIDGQTWNLKFILPSSFW